jgi:uncharacterized membrane protein
MTTDYFNRLLLLGESYLSWVPPLERRHWLMLAAVAIAIWLVLRIFWGQVKSRPVLGIWLLRAACISLALVILFGPTIIDESPGVTVRPAMLYLYDGSQSMKLGDKNTRWEESFAFTSEANSLAGQDHLSHVHAFRFGHRLEPLSKTPIAKENSDSNVLRPVVNRSTGDASKDSDSSIQPPTATDSRLADAMRELLPQVNSKHTSGIVLLSDGRVRATESVERLAELYGENGVPLHVVPIGRATGSGDIAIVSLVAASKVRKYTENQIQVFFRSFGMSGQRTTVRLTHGTGTETKTSSVLSSLPVTLADGAQSVTLTYRINERPEHLTVEIDPIAGELTERNNRVNTRVEIDRTKVRVLYLEGDSETASNASFLSDLANAFGGSTRQAGMPQTVQTFLQQDEDVDCVLLGHLGGGVLQGVNPNSTVPVAFPRTRSELFSYDCIIISNLSPTVLDEERSEWIAQWVEGRGGGLIVTGANSLNPIDWRDSKLLSMLPIRFTAGVRLDTSMSEISVTQPKHAIWRLKLEEELNAKLIGSIPKLNVSSVAFEVKPGADVLSKHAEENVPVMLGQRVGRGRVFLSTAALAGSGLRNLTDRWGTQSEQLSAKFWRNIVYWSTEGSSTGRRRLVAMADKQFYRPGESITVRAQAYDESARLTTSYRLWGMIEPSSLDDNSLYSPILWPENVPRDSGEAGPRVAWGEELPVAQDIDSSGYSVKLTLSENTGSSDEGLHVELTAYEGSESDVSFDHGTQVDSTSLSIHILSDPFEQQNPLPNHELLTRIASVSGGKTLQSPDDLAELLRSRPKTESVPQREFTPAWSKSWLWLCMIALLTTEWVWRKVIGMA